MFRIFLRTGIVALIAAVTVSSCVKATMDAAYSKQTERIEAFVKKQLSACDTLRVEYRTGSTRIVMSEGTGQELSSTGLALITYAGYDFTSGSISASSMFTTNSEDAASAARWNLTDASSFTPIVVDLRDETLYEGLRSGLRGVKAGEECYILFTGKYASPKHRIGTIPANAPLAFHIWIEDIEN